MLGFSSGGVLDRNEHGPNPRIMQFTDDELLALSSAPGVRPAERLPTVERAARIDNRRSLTPLIERDGGAVARTYGVHGSPPTENGCACPPYRRMSRPRTDMLAAEIVLVF